MKRHALTILVSLLLAAFLQTGLAREQSETALPDALSRQKWEEVERAVDRALAWMATQQQPDGSFRAPTHGQPAITSLAVMAYLSRGHKPGFGPYGAHLEKAIDYVLKTQQPGGLFSSRPPEPFHVHLGPSHTGAYNHAIAGLMLGEVYGTGSIGQAKQIKAAIEKALEFTRALQLRQKPHPGEQGGWRYLHPVRLSPHFVNAWGGGSDSDLSVTAWKLMFLRSARNAAFDVPGEQIEAALDYVERAFDPDRGVFYYGLLGADRYTSRGLMGAGTLCFSLGGQHHREIALRAGDWILANPFAYYGQVVGDRADRFHYAAYYCSQAMAQLGGKYWNRFLPPMVDALLSGQQPNGAWPPERMDSMFGNVYSTALSVLTLTPPYQLLPIYQR